MEYYAIVNNKYISAQDEYCDYGYLNIYGNI